VTAAPAAPAPPPSLAERIRTASTPARLKGFMYAVWALAAVLFLLGEGSVASALHAIKTVGKDTAPSIIAAQEISSGLADLDANAGNYLLGSRQNQVAAQQAFEERRAIVTRKLVDAARNITYGEAESAPINTIVDSLGRYLELYAEMRYRKDAGDATGALGVYSSATDLMHTKMLPAATALDRANLAHLQSDYEAEKNSSGMAEGLSALLAGVLVFVLLWGQILLVKWTRRIFNPALVAATVVAVAFGVYLISRASMANDELKVAKEDAFDSIHALWQARAVAYDANGDETRWLLFGAARGAEFERGYKDKVQKLTTVPQPPESMITGRKPPDTYKGYFGDELRNITFQGEKEAALKMIRAFAAYDKVDGAMRSLEKNNRHAEAVQKGIGMGPDESGSAIEHFDKALQEVVAINHKEFDAAVDRGMSALSLAEKVLPVASLLVAFLALFGIRPRLREYAA
jgi:hypothetical protein